MMINGIRAEWMKLRRSPVWLAFLLVPVVPAFMGTFNYVQNQAILDNGWYSLWTQHTLFSCYFFLPALIGIYASYLWRLEHSHTNWNAILSAPVPHWLIHASKLVILKGVILITQVWIGVLFVVSGFLVGVNGPIPPELTVWLADGLLGGLVIGALQLSLSLVMRSFALPVGVAVLGGISGLLMTARGLGVWFPYALISLGMRANRPGGEMQCDPRLFVINGVLFVLAFSVFSVMWIKKRDVAAG